MTHSSGDLVKLYKEAERRWFKTRLRRVASDKEDAEMARHGQSIGWLFEYKDRFCIRACTLIPFWHRVARGLHVFTFGPDWVVAHDAHDAWQVWTEFTLEKDPDYRADLTPVPDEEPIPIWCNADGPCEPFDDAANLTTLSAAAWAQREGRGFLASTEI